jgi:hypothetical protein
MTTSPFANPITAGNVLVQPAIQSPNFVSGVSGWAIFENGSAQFNNITLTGGSVIVSGGGQGIFVYSGIPAFGNLIVSMASAAGSDAYGNAYPEGFGVSAGQIPGGLINAGTITNTQIAALAVTAAKIAANTITTAQIALAAGITGTQIASATIGASNIIANTITASQIAANTITAAQIQAATITTGQIAAGTITGSNIAAGTITAANILTSTITAAQLAAGIVYAGIVNGTTITGATIIADGSSGEFLIYSGTPATGNLVGSWSASAGTDAYTNAYPAGLNVTMSSGGGTISGPDYILNSNGLFFYSGIPAANNLVGWITQSSGTDAYGNNYVAGLNVGGYFGAAANSYAALVPQQNAPFSITNAISGTLEAIAALSTGAGTIEAFPGFSGALSLNTGTSEKLAHVLASPSMNTYGTGSCAIILESQNQGGTDTAVITFGTMSSPDAETFVFTPIVSISAYAMLMYSGASGTVVVTKTSGSGTIPIPAGVTSAKAECWGSAGGAGYGGNGSNGAGGGGGGEYAAEPALVVPSGGTVAYVVGAAGTAGTASLASTTGASSTLTGSSVTVTGHGGTQGTGSTAGTGGSGSTNTVHDSGGAGGLGSTTGAAGGGGGASGGTGGAGGAGHQPGGSGNVGGPGGVAQTGGANGGQGGNAGQHGNAGLAPGGAAGGGANNQGSLTSGAGQVRLTYTTGGPAILHSIALAAGTDQYGTAYSAGTVLPGPADTVSYNSGPKFIKLTAGVPVASITPVTIFTHHVAIGDYYLHGVITGANGSTGTLQEQTIEFTGTCAVSGMRVTVRSAQTATATSTAALGQVGGLGSIPAGGRTPALSEVFTIEWDGFITVSTAGTLIIGGLCVTSASDVGWTADAYSYSMVNPSIT